MQRIVFPLEPGMRGAAVGDLQAALQLLLDRAVILENDGQRDELTVLLRPERGKSAYADVTQRLVGEFQIQVLPKPTGIVDEPTAAALNKLLASWGMFPADEPATPRVLEGRVLLEDGRPAGQTLLRFYRRDFATSTLLAESRTTEDGRYTVTFDAAALTGGLELRAVHGDAEESLSRPLTELPATLNVVAPASLQPLESEYRRLTADLEPLVGDLAALAGAGESSDNPQLSLLNRGTGWDARLIALAANTERLNADPAVTLPAEQLYGLLRAGLPADPLMLAQVGAEAATTALATAMDAGIVAADDLKQFAARFTEFAGKVRLGVAAPG